MAAFFLMLAIAGWIALPLSIPFVGGYIRVGQPNSKVGAMLGWASAVMFILAVIWASAALVWPIIEHFPDWAAIQGVYYDWQALNVGMAALCASLIAFHATRLRVQDDVSRMQRSAQAQLPQALSTLSDFLEPSIAYFFECYCRAHATEEADAERDGEADPFGIDGPPEYLPDGPPPEIPDGFEATFVENLKYAPYAVYEQLALVLEDVQVFESRYSHFNRKVVHYQPSAIALKAREALAFLTVIMVRVDRLYAYGRLHETFNGAPFSEVDLSKRLKATVYNSELYPELLVSLSRALGRANRDKPGQRGHRSDNPDEPEEENDR